MIVFWYQVFSLLVPFVPSLGLERHVQPHDKSKETREIHERLMRVIRSSVYQHHLNEKFEPAQGQPV